MLRFKGLIFASFFAIQFSMAQETIVRGQVVDAFSETPLSNVQVNIEETNLFAFTDDKGVFEIYVSNKIQGNFILKISLGSYVQQRFPLNLEPEKEIDLRIIGLQPDFNQQDTEIALISLSEMELEEDGIMTSNVSGLLTSANDVFYNAAAYDFGTTFFSIRGLDNQYQKQLLNGVELNQFTTGRPEWGNFGGINDVMRNQEFSPGLANNKLAFGGINGTTNTSTRASDYRKGGKIAFAQSNRTYRQRVIASYGSGKLQNGWAYSVLLSRRMGNHGYQEGTKYDANSAFLSVERQLGEKQSLNLTAFYTPNKRGKSTIMTEEVRDIKGLHYNPLWGKQGNKDRNQREKEVKQPFLMLNHYWDISEKVELQTNMAYRFGTIGNTRIDNGGTRLIKTADGQKAYVGGAPNPTPEYYQNLPSYFLRNEQPDAFDFQKAYLAGQEFKANGQLDWQALYEANAISEQNGGNAIYALQEDIQDDRQLTFSSVLNTSLNERVDLAAGLNYTRLNNQNYARIKDLLGAEGYLDIDFYADEPDETAGIITDLAQSDINNPDRMVRKGDRYKYNYEIEVNHFSGFTQFEFNTRKADFFISGNISQTDYQRDGKYKNGYFPEESFGKGEQLSFTDFGVKGGILYKYTGQHMFGLNAGYMTKAPVIQNAYTNPRQNGIPVIGIESEKIQLADLSYIYRSPIIKARLTGFYSEIKDASEIGFYFAQGLSGMGEKHDAAFVQEMTTGINTRHLGVEYGIEVKATPTIVLKAVGSLRQSLYTNNPNLYLTSEDFKASLMHGEQKDFAENHVGTPLMFGNGKTHIKGYHPAGGPERAFQFGLEYRDPSYWFMGTTANFFGDAYVSMNNLRRSDNFSRDVDGLTFNDYDPDRAASLLKQEKLGNYMLLNLVGGKSWRVNQYYIGFFGVVSNLLNQAYRSGGFESGRKASYFELNRDQSAPYGPQFGNKYFYGYGTTFYFNVYVRF